MLNSSADRVYQYNATSLGLPTVPVPLRPSQHQTHASCAPYWCETVHELSVSVRFTRFWSSFCTKLEQPTLAARHVTVISAFSGSYYPPLATSRINCIPNQTQLCESQNQKSGFGQRLPVSQYLSLRQQQFDTWCRQDASVLREISGHFPMVYTGILYLGRGSPISSGIDACAVYTVCNV